MAGFLSRGPAHTQRMAKTIFRRLLAGKRCPVILALSGELGSGKTTFIQGLAKTLGIREKIQSPTFVLMKWYQLSKPFHHLHHFRYFIHIDAYRIESATEARHLGLKEIFKDQDAIIVVEWAERIRKFIPGSAVWVNFKHGKKSQERSIKLVKRVK